MLDPLSSHFHRPLFHLSSLMNRCCSAVGVNKMDWVAGRHILLLRESERGHLDSEQHARVPWLFCIPHLLPSISLTSSLTFKSLSTPKPHPQHSTTHCLVHLSPCQTFCSTDHLPVMCPCPQLEKPAGEKVKIFIIRSKRPLRSEGGKKERNSRGKNARDVIEWRLHKKSLNIFEIDKSCITNLA